MSQSGASGSSFADRISVRRRLICRALREKSRTKFNSRMNDKGFIDLRAPRGFISARDETDQLKILVAIVSGSPLISWNVAQTTNHCARCAAATLREKHMLRNIAAALIVLAAGTASAADV